MEPPTLPTAVPGMEVSTEEVNGVGAEARSPGARWDDCHKP